MLYIYSTKMQSYLMTKAELSPINSLNSYLNKLAATYLFSLKDYRKSVKKYLLFQRDVPYFFSKNLILFPLVINEGRYYMNYNNILGVYWDSKQWKILFHEGKTINIGINIERLKRQFKKVEKIIEYKEKLL